VFRLQNVGKRARVLFWLNRCRFTLVKLLPICFGWSIISGVLLDRFRCVLVKSLYLFIFAAGAAKMNEVRVLNNY